MLEMGIVQVPSNILDYFVRLSFFCAITIILIDVILPTEIRLTEAMTVNPLSFLLCYYLFVAFYICIRDLTVFFFLSFFVIVVVVVVCYLFASFGCRWLITDT